MIHFLPLAADRADSPASDREVHARVAGLRRALRLVEPSAGGPADDVDLSDWDSAGPEIRRCFDWRSERSIAGAAAGLEAVVAERRAGQSPGDPVLELLAADIRAALADLSSLVRGASERPQLAVTADQGLRLAPDPWG